MQPEYLIVGEPEIHEKLKIALLNANIVLDTVLFITPDDPTLPDIVEQFAPDNKLIVDDILQEAIRKRELTLNTPIRIERVELSYKAELKPSYREDPHPHIPKHLKRKYPRR